MPLAQLPKLKLKSGVAVVDQIYDALREAIVSQILLPGDPLSETALAAHFGVSRYPVRTVMTRLQLNQLLEIVPQKGTFVRKISVARLYEICFVRCAVESQAVRDAARLPAARRERILGKLQKSLAAQERACGEPAPHRKFLRLDDEFHRALCLLSGGDLAWQIINVIKANNDRIRYMTIDHGVDPQDVLADHRRMTEDVGAGRWEEACAVIAAHAYGILENSRAIRAANAAWFSDAP